MVTVEELRKIPLFSGLEQKELEYLASTVPDIHLEPGEYVANEGEGRALIIVIEGKLELTKQFAGVEKFIAHRLPGALFGEVPIVLNSSFLASARAVEPTRAIRIEPKVFYTLAASAPEVASTVAASAMGRIGGLQELAKNTTRPELLVIGPRWQPAVHVLRNFLHRNQIDFEWLGPEDPAAILAAPGATTYPVVRLAGGKVLVDPSTKKLAEAVGLSVAPKHPDYDVVIVGGGPAGISAAVYGASEGLRTMVVEREAPGGQAGTSSRIENYLGFPNGVTGDELSTRALQQARRLGAEIVVTRAVERIDPVSGTVVLDGGDVLQARTIFLAMGVTWRRLAIESLDRLTGRGIYYGAAGSEANAMQGLDVFLIGAGNSAGQAAVFFSNYARSVTLVVRGDSLGKSMSHYLIQQIRAKANVKEFLRSEVVGVHGNEHLEAIDIHDAVSGKTTRHEAAGLFIFIGADASTDWLPKQVARDIRGYVLTGTEAQKTGAWTGSRHPFLLETTVPGIFAVGDVRSSSVKRVASAVGDGSLAISFAHQHLDELSRRGR